MFFLLWTVRTVRGSVQVLWVYLQLSNLDFWVRLWKGRVDNNLWLTNKTRSCVYWRFGTRSVQILMCPSFTLTPADRNWCRFVVCQLTRWVHGAKTDAKYSVHHVWSVLPQRGEWFAKPYVGFLSNFQQFLLWYVQFIDVNWFIICTKIDWSWKFSICFKYRSVLLLLQNRECPHCVLNEIKDSFENSLKERSWIELPLKPQT